MKNLKRYFLATICFAAQLGFAQEKNFDISTPVGIDPVGLNKVLCMKNGNTVLFHFEPGKPMMVKVFDADHKRIANTQPECNILDIGSLRTLVFKGLYDIGGEAVLFIEQQNSGRHSLVMLRVNGTNGRKIDERTIGKSKSMAKPAKFFVMKDRKEDDYAIFYCNDVPQFKSCELHLTWYNSKHEVYKEVPLVLDRKKYDYLDVVGADLLPDGACISLGLSTLVMNGTGTFPRTVSVGQAGQSGQYEVGQSGQYDVLSEGVGSSLENAPIYDHHLAIFFIPKDSARAVSKLVDVSQEVYPYYAQSSYNPFAKSVNLLLLSYRDALYRYGLELRPTSLTSNLFFKLDEDNLAASYTWMNNQLANQSLKEHTDTGNFFKGLPLKLSTNNNGLSTLVSESYSRFKNIESSSRTDVFETFFGDIGVTQFDDDGKEIWGTVLPKSQYLKSYRHYYSAAELGKRAQQQEMFGDLPRQVYDRQFVSCNTYNNGNDQYIVFNDYNKNLQSNIEAGSDTVFTFDHTNTCYYKINKKKEVSKQYMFGDPLTKEYKASFIEGADFDEQRGTYASLIQYKRGEYTSLRMAWRHLD